MPLSSETCDLFNLSFDDQRQCEAWIEQSASETGAWQAAREAQRQGRGSLMEVALFDLCSQGEEGARAEALSLACESAFETREGQRLCACLLLIRVGTSADWTRLPEALTARLRAQGFSPDARLLSLEQAQAMGFDEIDQTHARALSGDSPAPSVLFPAPRGSGLQLRVAVASLPGAGRGEWDAMSSADQGLALASFMDLCSAGWGAGMAAGVAAGSFSHALRQAHAVGCPIALRALVLTACGSTRSEPVDLAASCSLHSADELGGAFWRIAARAKDTGFFLAGLDWPLNGMSSDEAFYDGVIRELSELGVDECYVVSGDYDAHLCDRCLEPLYPVPDHAPWREAALASDLNPNGEHFH